jgi:hypothetical protein
MIAGTPLTRLYAVIAPSTAPASTGIRYGTSWNSCIARQLMLLLARARRHSWL